ncbi:MAG: beta-ketoacyl-ACP synthase III [Bacteroidota bacterium]|nr:beta-ketoacyl-ACP synthase III [Bacteroidota bacterium]
MQNHSNITAAITGIASYLPDYILTNAELEQMMDTTDEWITSRTGIKERRLLKGENQGVSVIGVEAVKKLLEKTNTDPLSIDMVIFATVTPDMVFPATANLVSDQLGMKNAWGFDLEAACSGFIYALTVASQFIKSGVYKKIIVIGADKMSSIINYEDRQTAVIFGDGGGAVLLEPNTEGLGIQDFIMRADGSGVKYLHQKAGGSRKPASIETVTNLEHYVYQEGQSVFKFAVTNMADISAEIMERNHLTADDIQWLVAHQANKRIIDATRQRMGLAEEKVMMNIHKYGNTTAGTIPLLLSDYESLLMKGDNLIIAAFGGGFTWGSIYLKWSI